MFKSSPVHTLPYAPVSRTCARPRPVAPLYSAVLTVTGLPRQLRMEVENAVVECIQSPPEAAPAGTDPLTARWCISWSRDRRMSEYYAVQCRDIISGTEAELEALSVCIEELAAAHPGARIDGRVRSVGRLI